MILGWRLHDTVLPLAVMIVGLIVGAYWLRSQLLQVQDGPQAVSERNERSTPRSFVLPATPAVAYEQEMRARKSPSLAHLEDQLAVCAGRLIDLGYDVGDEAVMFNAKLVEAIYEYQESKGLHATGRLDGATIARLACKAK